jgi:hypothetical protein
LNGVQNGGSKKLGLNNLVPVLKQMSMEYMFKSVFSFEVEVQGAHVNREADIIQFSNGDVAVAQRQL